MPVDKDDAAVCRICLDPDPPLIRPCNCRGTVSSVHPRCLKRWREFRRNERDYWECRQCGTRYRFSYTLSLLAKSYAARVITSLSIIFIIDFALAFSLKYLVADGLSQLTIPAHLDDSLWTQLNYFPAAVVRFVLDYLVFGGRASQKQWQALFKVVPGHLIELICRQFVVGVGLLGLIGSTIRWGPYFIPFCVTSYYVLSETMLASSTQLKHAFWSLLMTCTLLGACRMIESIGHAIVAVARRLHRHSLNYVLDTNHPYIYLVQSLYIHDSRE